MLLDREREMHTNAWSEGIVWHQAAEGCARTVFFFFFASPQTISEYIHLEFFMLIRMVITRSKRSLQTTTVEETTKRQKTTVTTKKVEKVEAVQKTPTLEPPSTPKKKRPPVPQVELDHNAPQAEPAGRAGLLSEFVKGLDHCIKVDPSLKPIIDKSAFTTFDQERIAREEKLPSFGYLVRSIIGQQISGAAARSVLLKFLAVFGLSSSNNEQRTVFPTPRQVLDKSTETLRGAGLSARKVEYVQGIASAYERGELSDEILKTSNDDDVVDMLVALKGIGRMLLFLKRQIDDANF